MTRKLNLIVFCLMSVLGVALLSGAAMAQQAVAADMWQLAPSDSLLVAAFDARPSNASVQALINSEDPETRELRAKQSAAMRKAVEDLVTLFGISLDFAKDIDSWSDQQWAVVILPDGKSSATPVLMIASKDAVAANATLQKLLAPWQRVGEVTAEPDADCTITTFKVKNSGINVYISACGPVVALSPSKAGLKQALKGGGFAAGSPADKVFKALSGSMFYAFVDPKLFAMLKSEVAQIPVDGYGLGVSVIETGAKIRVLGLPNEAGATLLKQVLASRQPGALTVNPGIPSTSLVAASFPDLSGPLAMIGISGMSKSPIFGAVQAITNTQISAALTAALPLPAGVASIMAESDQAAIDKLSAITASLKKSNIPMQPVQLPGIQATLLRVPDCPSLYLSQAGKYILLASDTQSLTSAVATAKGEQPSIVQSETYKETIAGLGDSNLLTLYGNLAPIQGLGFLIEGLGLGQVQPLYGSIAKGLENLQALGVGLGFDGEMASATIFLRAKPGGGQVIGPVAAVTGAVFGVGAVMAFERSARVPRPSLTPGCAAHLKELELAARMYAADWDDKLPTSANWQSQLKVYTKVPISELKCPDGNSIYAFNKNLSGINLSKIERPSDVVVFFEARPGLPNASGSRANAILPHNGRGWFAFADGHVESLCEVPDQSHWVPTIKPVKKAPVNKAPAKKLPASGKRHK